MTFAELMTKVENLLREKIEDDLIMDALSDSAIAIWEALILVNLSEFLGGPATGQFAQVDQEQSKIVAITDPAAGPALAAVVQGALAGANPQVSYTYVTDSGAETLASPQSVIALPPNNILKVTSPARVAIAIGWNLYVNGIRQNEEPIPQGTDWYEDEVNGFVLDGDSVPDKNTTADDIWYLQTLYVDTPQGNKFWQEEEIGSELWQQFARSSAVASPYQPYVYDFDGSQVTIRPLSGGNIDYKYFYVRRPREFKYKSATVPFRHPAAPVFMKYNALALIHLALHEYTSSSAWQGKADKEMMTITMSSAKRNVKKNKTIRPIFR